MAQGHGGTRDLREPGLVSRGGHGPNLRRRHAHGSRNSCRAGHDEGGREARNGRRRFRHRLGPGLSSGQLRVDGRARRDRRGHGRIWWSLHHPHALRGGRIPGGHRRGHGDRGPGRGGRRDLSPQGRRSPKLAQGRTGHREDRLGPGGRRGRAGEHVPVRGGRHGADGVLPTLGVRRRQTVRQPRRRRDAAPDPSGDREPDRGVGELLYARYARRRPDPRPGQARQPAVCRPLSGRHRGRDGEGLDRRRHGPGVGRAPAGRDHLLPHERGKRGAPDAAALDQVRNRRRGREPRDNAGVGAPEGIRDVSEDPRSLRARARCPPPRGRHPEDELGCGDAPVHRGSRCAQGGLLRRHRHLRPRDDHRPGYVRGATPGLGGDARRLRERRGGGQGRTAHGCEAGDDRAWARLPGARRKADLG